MYRNIWVCAIRGGVGFLGGALLVFGHVWLERSGLNSGFLTYIAVTFAAGAVGGLALTVRRGEPQDAIRTAFGFGIGWVVAAFVALFAMISI